MGTPTCPACGAKFSHSKAMLACSKCGLPDDVRDLGPREVQRWKAKRAEQLMIDNPKLAGKLAPKKQGRRHHKKHGRPKGRTSA
jgi:hypothetical protein